MNITNIGASDIFSISFPTADTGYVAGGVDAFLKTENGAESWSDINFSPMFNVTIVDFCSASTGYASDGYDLYKTTNYGETWLLLPILSPMDRIIAIECISNEVCYIAGDDPLLTTYILKTLDGGETWVNTSFEAHLSAPNKIMCLNDSICYALSSNGLGTEFYLLKTINSGSMASTYSLDKITIDVYPNPATDLIYIKTNFLEAISSITIIDILGNILIKKNTFEPAIDINNLHSGVYFIEINIDNQRHQFKFIKK